MNSNDNINGLFGNSANVPTTEFLGVVGPGGGDGGGGGEISVEYHNDLKGRDAQKAHPATSIDWSELNTSPNDIASTVKDGQVVFNTYNDFKTATVITKPIVTIKNFKGNDDRLNVLYNYNGVWIPNNNIFNINEDDVKDCDFVCEQYRIYTSPKAYELWTMIEQAVDGKAGLGSFDSDGVYDLDIRYNANGDEFVKSKYLAYNDYVMPNDSDFYTGFEEKIIPVRGTPTSIPPKAGMQLFNPDTGDYIISVDTTSALNWKVL